MSIRVQKRLPKTAEHVRPHVHVLGIDPGMRRVGWAVFRLYRDGLLDLVVAGAYDTAKATKKAKVLATDDNFRRARLVSRHIYDLAVEYDVKAICAEAMSFPRSSSVAAKMAMCWGSIAMLAELRDPLPVIQVTPQMIKKTCGVLTPPRAKAAKLGPNPTPAEKEARKLADKEARTRKAASKSDVQDAMVRRFPLLGDLLGSLPLADREHPADACAAALVGLGSDEIRTLRSMIAAC